MILIGQYDSPFVRRVGIALTLFGLPFEHRPWSVFGDADLVRAHNPLVRVPTLVLDDGVALIESHVILDYLDDLVGPQRAMFPPGGDARRDALRISALAAGMGDKAVALFYEQRLHQQVSPVWVERCRSQVLAVGQALEIDRAARTSDWWLGDRLGHADIVVATVLRFANEAHPGLLPMDNLPLLRAHSARMEALPVFQSIAQPFMPPARGRCSMEPGVVQASSMPAGVPYVPVAIVGAGACGLAAALTLRDAGVDCVLLERDAQPAGSTALSSGFIPAAGTSMQREAGIDDSPAQFARDIQAKAHGTAAPHLVDAFSTHIGPVVQSLWSKHAIEFIVIDGFLYPGHSVRRMHAVPEKTGAALVARLERAALAAGADIVTQATVCELWVDPGERVTGVGYQRPDGTLEHLRCDALILACNGFGGNAAMVRELLPEMRDALFAGHTGNDGSAIAWGRALGARLADLGGYQGHGSWAVPQGALISWALMMEGGIQLNAHGERFHDETQGYSEAAVQVLAQPGGVVWNVFDGPILELARGFPDFCAAEAAGAVKTCADAPALASLIGCEATKIIATLDQLMRTTGPFDSKNGDGVRSRATRVFKRPLVRPLYAVKVTGALFHTQGGLDIDAQCRVLREDGTPFPNLLAAGGAARGVSGNAVWGYLSGNGLLSAVAGGAIAATTAAAFTNRGTP